MNWKNLMWTNGKLYSQKRVWIAETFPAVIKEVVTVMFAIVQLGKFIFSTA